MRRVCASQRVTEALEAAVAAQPGARSLLEALFVAHVKSGDAARAQRAAQKAYRAAPTERHLLWVASSLIAQAAGAAGPVTAEQADDAAARTGAGCAAALCFFAPLPPPRSPADVPPAAAPLLALAEGLLARGATPASPSSPSLLCSQAGWVLRAHALAAAGKAGDAAAMLGASPAAAAAFALPADRLRLVASHAEAAHDWTAAAAAHAALLDAHPDDWAAAVGAARVAARAAAAAAAAAGGRLDGADAAAAVRAVEARVRAGLAAAEAASPPPVQAVPPVLISVELRAALLRLALHRTARGGGASAADKSAVSEAAAELGDAVAAHSAAWSSSPSCAPDLGQYAFFVRQACPAAARALVAALGAQSEAATAELRQIHSTQSGDGDAATAAKAGAKEAAALRRLATAAALRLDAGGWSLPRGAHGGAGGDDACASDRAEWRAEVLPLAAAARAAVAAASASTGGAGDPRQGFACDGTWRAAAESAALSAFHRPSTSSSIFAPPSLRLLFAACLAAEGLASSPHCSSLSLCLASALSLLGCGTAAHAACRPLRLRHVQTDSMAHVALPPLLCCPHLSQRHARHFNTPPPPQSQPPPAAPSGAVVVPTFEGACAPLRALHKGHARPSLQQPQQQQHGGPGGGGGGGGGGGNAAGDAAAAAHVAGSSDEALAFDAFAERLAASHAHALVGIELAARAAFWPQPHGAAQPQQGDGAEEEEEGADAEAAPPKPAQPPPPPPHASQPPLPPPLPPLVEPSDAFLRAMRFNADAGPSPRFAPPAPGGWHAAVAHWWDAEPRADGAKNGGGGGGGEGGGGGGARLAWGARFAARCAEGGGAGRRAASREALVDRWAPLAGLRVVVAAAAAAAAGGGTGGADGRGGVAAAAEELRRICARVAPPTPSLPPPHDSPPQPLQSPQRLCAPARRLPGDAAAAAALFAARDVALALASRRAAPSTPPSSASSSSSAADADAAETTAVASLDAACEAVSAAAAATAAALSRECSAAAGHGRLPLGGGVLNAATVALREGAGCCAAFASALVALCDPPARAPAPSRAAAKKGGASASAGGVGGGSGAAAAAAASPALAAGARRLAHASASAAALVASSAEEALRGSAPAGDAAAALVAAVDAMDRAEEGDGEAGGEEVTHPCAAAAAARAAVAADVVASIRAGLEALADRGRELERGAL